jgi:F-type H+-transporting ATPase subunit b
VGFSSVTNALVGSAEAGGRFTDLNFGLTLWTIVLFGLFALVLAKYAWRPLLDLIELRERTVREHVERAEKAHVEASQALAEQQELLRQAHRQREELILKAMKEAEAVRAEIVARARTEADHAIERAREQIGREKDLAVIELRSYVADIAVEAAGKIVRSSLDQETQRALVNEYLTGLPAIKQ